MYIAHIRQKDDVKQTVREHLLECKTLSESYGEHLGLKHLAGLGGLLHDVGKYSNKFLCYLTQAVYDPENAPARGSVDHSTAGGKLLFERYHIDGKNPYYQLVAEVVGNAIISHHSSLQDFSNDRLESPYLKRVEEKEVYEFQDIKERFFQEVMSEDKLDKYVEMAAGELQSCLSACKKEDIAKQLYFLTRFVFSALVDADRTNTRQFEDNWKDDSVDSMALFERYDERLERKIQSLRCESDDTVINQLRQKMSDKCAEAADLPSDIYTLSIPTGGGKTLASLRYALKHALKFKKKRIIYVVPFTTIIEQNAAEVCSILGDWTHIIEHHSNVIDADEENEFTEGSYTNQEKVKLARDNWDSPVIFTTMVQFLEAFYGHGSRSARRLHNLCEAVVIFDEVQKVPTKSVTLFNQALNFLKYTGKSSLLLCTATQPALDFVEGRLEIGSDHELVPDLQKVEVAFKRTNMVDMTGEGTYATNELADFAMSQLDKENSVLVILNTKSVVKKLYLELKERNLPVELYHLSTSMCASHRKDVLREIRDMLEKGEQLICVTTQLIEAGVDVDFGCVIRSLAGLDSIAQAAGRCNRHGKQEIKNVYIIDHAEEDVSKMPDVARGKEITARLLRVMEKDKTLFKGNMLSNQAMTRYFKEFYTVQESVLMYPLYSLGTSISEILFSTPFNHPFIRQMKHQLHKQSRTFMSSSFMLASMHFQVIDRHTYTVLVPYDHEAKEMIADLNGKQQIEDLSRLMIKGQQYTVNVHKWEKDLLAKQGMLISYLDGSILAMVDNGYSAEFGLDVNGEGVNSEAYYI
ncbi:CRISPR-associated helicase Cas3' [Sutcliffiella rhizosphaerae]|uniref:CRISPR-associated helicase Cas3 n=1 Tax=Sutcliffiella rhizosphaerae TaxID=2880967 RepID=A0ABN8AJH1_9BACI|nr:CRISPR-associated helicase Cas3' [Sutcliffiella rhizosphaerae]CAG9623050.1 hypothetical protein BACCIP111883_03845 [Sutcliffiella rhizosphaerae]